jgi:primosomal protein N' (replication factor Y)
VPFGAGLAVGFYLGPALPPTDPTLKGKLKPLVRVLDAKPALPADVVELVRFAAEHYRHPLGEVLKAALPPTLKSSESLEELRPEAQRFVLAEACAQPESLGRAPGQAAALSYLLAVGGRALVEEVRAAVPGATTFLKSLEKKGWVRFEDVAVPSSVRAGLEQARPERLTPEQSTAVEEVRGALDAGGFTPFLLHGVTGSGKTEVYLRAVEHALSQGKGSLVLVPEIALTPQLVGRFRSRLGGQVAVLHSGLKDKERLLAWRGLREGELKVAVGVRSAVFAPISNLGLVVVDEEHDGSFKQEEGVRYHARDLAVMRAKQAQGVVLLGSATPSLETLENARRGRYRRLELKARVDDRPLPRVELVDLREVRPRTFGPEEEAPLLAPPALEALAETLDRGQQAIVFLNRRGHSTYLVCAACGESLRCHQCDVSLTHHLKAGQVRCHYCGDARPLPQVCPACEGQLLKLGVGTQRVEAELRSRFPKARVGRLDRDQATSAEKLTELLAAFARRELDVLVGTQMVAKGHDFPGVTLVCVALADVALGLPDFRAAERTFQQLTQVAGRAGRGVEPGRVLLQTYHPEAEAVRRALTHDFHGFAQEELTWRQRLAYPPFQRLVALRLDGVSARAVEEAARTLARVMEERLPATVRLLGPAPAPLTLLRGRTRWQLLLKAQTHRELVPLLVRAEQVSETLTGGVRLAIDVDPVGML